MRVKELEENGIKILRAAVKGAEVKHNGGISPELRNKGVRELEKGGGPSCDEALGFLLAHDRPPPSLVQILLVL